MHQSITDVLFKEPSSVSHATVKAILGDDLCVVLTRRADWYGVDGLAKVIRQRAPHRLSCEKTADMIEAMWKAEGFLVNRSVEH